MDQFLQIDNRIKELNDQLRNLREKRNLVEAHIIKHNLQHSQCKIVETKHAEPITFRYLEKSLGEIIPDKDQVEQIITYLKDKRETKKVPDLRRVYRNDAGSSEAPWTK